jgi:cobalt-zinc-cadmium efflux system protein
MLVIAVAGLLVNLIAMRLLAAGSSESLNVKGAYLEVWADMVGSLGVLIAAALIKVTGWLVLDPILAVLIGLWVLPRTWTLAREAVNVLLEGVPHGTDLPAVRTAILGQPGVTGVHDLHVWALGSRQAVLAAHVITEVGIDAEDLRQRINATLHDSFRIEHSTLQLETSHCAEGGCDDTSSQDDHEQSHEAAHRH